MDTRNSTRVAATPAPSATVGAACPSCGAAMEVLELESNQGQPLELDLCFACHGIWFDHRESLQLSPASILALFKTLHAHRDEPHQPLRERMRCPRGPEALERGADRTKSGVYVVYRCPERHGRFSTFASFMVEKGFVRHLNGAEIHALARQVRVIHCSSCGAAVDLRRDHACPYCRSAFSLLDPQAVEQALARYQGAAGGSVSAVEPGASTTMAPQAAETSAEVLVAQERVRMEHRRRAQERRHEPLSGGLFEDELWSTGLELVWRTIGRLLR
ncbi:hypothetical protein D8I35_05870 [Corticibacter populi]|uniref:Transcription factor zinc-finger domain-containing protein n=1 Tax=Corticibacter populi TaxID=1550736 RepID=A0A3M6R069_9BURK|nr:zf-TFIIB domain-containing protein [Corticibacter populi]RMX08595.1 hypothetical protein D8I35_05870 [Corticibacter populi]RZS35921.1 TFIIB-like protein [Corticibacter populi]